MNEFDLIERYFVRPNNRGDVVVGIGDDAAVCAVPDNHELVLTTDLLVAGVHFPTNAPARAIGHKALAVNLSDLAAMGASPAWFTLSLSLPDSNETWLQEFSKGLLDLADTHGIALVGGDTVEGPMTIGIQACGFVPDGAATLRSGANVGDHIFVTGSLGDAALGLQVEQKKLELDAAHNKYFSTRLAYPVPRVIEGMEIRDIASAMIDISDGLLADLGHILDSSRLGANIRLADTPISDSYSYCSDRVGWGPALTGGDDYELCFTVAPDRVESIMKLATEWDCGIRDIGRIESASGLRIYDRENNLFEISRTGFEHFTGK